MKKGAVGSVSFSNTREIIEDKEFCVWISSHEDGDVGYIYMDMSYEPINTEDTGLSKVAV